MLDEACDGMTKGREREKEKLNKKRENARGGNGTREGSDRYQRRNRSIWNEIKYARKSTGVITSVEEKYSAPLPEG